MASAGLARRLSGPLGVLAGVVAGFGWVRVVDPYQPGRYPGCLLYQRTGILCPGCGGLRGAHSLAHGDLAAALAANALALVGYALLAVVLGVWTVRTLRGTRSWGGLAGGGRADRLRGRLRTVSARCRWAWVVGALVVFTVVRNLPCGAALRP